MVVLRLALALALVAVATSGCSADVSLEGRPCPCGEGFSCDVDRDVCVRGAVRLCSQDEPVAASPIQITELRLLFRTDHGLGWGWTVGGTRAEIERYALIVGRSRDEALRLEPGAIVYDRDNPEYPELNRATLPDTTLGDDVDEIVLRELEPDTSYFVRLVLFDRTGSVSCSEVVEARTWLEARSEAVFYDEDPFGFALPGCVSHVADPARAARGTHLALYTIACERQPDGRGTAVCGPAVDPATSCFENVRLHDLPPVAVDIAPGPFRDQAHLSVDVALDDSGPALWSEIGLRTRARAESAGEPPLAGERIWIARRQTIVADGSYRTYSAPLSTLTLRCVGDQMGHPRCDREPVPEDFAAGVVGLRVGVVLTHGGSARIDAGRIRW